MGEGQEIDERKNQAGMYRFLESLRPSVAWNKFTCNC